MYFCDVDNRQSKQLTPGILARTFWGANMLVSVVDFLPDSIVGLHSHPHEQIGVVMEGQVEMTIGGEARVLKPGDMYIIPGGVEHAGRSVGGPAKVLDIFSPVREEYKY